MVLDPVLSSAMVLSDGERYVLLLGKTQELDGRTEQTYALCAPDGSWCTDFLYSDIFAMPDGRLCLCDIRYDENGQYTGDLNNACIMDYDGSVTLNLSEIRPEIPLGDIQASPDFQYSMLGMSEGYARVDLEEGRSVFMDSTGKLLRSDEFDGYFATAFSFSGGDLFKIFHKNLTCTTLRAHEASISNHENRANYGPHFGQHVPERNGKKPLIRNPVKGGVPV